MYVKSVFQKKNERLCLTLSETNPCFYVSQSAEQVF